MNKGRKKDRERETAKKKNKTKGKERKKKKSALEKKIWKNTGKKDSERKTKSTITTIKNR